MKKILPAFIFLSFIFPSFSQITINEISTANSAILADNDGDFSDWLELYNSSSSTIDLTNYRLSDDPFVNNKWVFPNVSIGAEDYLLVYASGKNKNDFIDHWEFPVVESMNWSYIVPDSSTSDSWITKGFDDAAWLTDQGGFGYGDDDDATLISDEALSVFIRTSFMVDDLSIIQAMTLYLDYDDGFVAYLNGHEIARDNISPSQPKFDDLADQDHEALIYNNGQPSEFSIDPSLIESHLVMGENVLAIQVHNNAVGSSDLTARPFLAFGINNSNVTWAGPPSWFLMPPSGYFLHTNFALNDNQESILLFNASGSAVDGFAIPDQIRDVSYGRETDGDPNFVYFEQPTPGESNNSSIGFEGLWDDVLTFDTPAGFYSSSQNVTISAANVESIIRYTLDGSEPNQSSSPYSGPISISETTVLRAGAFKTNYITKSTETNSYLIGSDDDPTNLGVISISVNPDDFFDENIGIYELGPNASGVAPNYGANFWQDWERKIHFEFFDESGEQVIEQDCGVKIFGGWSRNQDMKSLRLIARDEYGDKSFSYQFFPDKKNDSYRQLVLRNSGNDFNRSHLRDALNHEVVKSIGNHDLMAVRTVAVFINGEYFGVHHLRERMNHHYVEDNHGFDDDNVHLIENSGTGSEGAKRGDYSKWTELTDFIINNSMTDENNYQFVADNIDIENMIDYFASQTYHINWDAPFNNCRIWRPMDESKGWRYMYYDTDFGLDLFRLSYTGPTHDELDRWINDDRSSHTVIFKNLLTNSTYKHQFINRYADLMNSVYRASNYGGVLDSLKNHMSPDMDAHFDRWGASRASWDANIDDIESFINSRASNVQDHIIDQFSLNKTVDLKFEINNPNQGKIKVNTIIHGLFPWDGVYFDGCPITLTAIPEEGYEFSHWTSSGSGISGQNNSESISVNFSSDQTVTAHFNISTNIARITFSELNYNSPDNLDAGDWVELHNWGTDQGDIGGWVFKDDNDFNEFVIPDGTILEAGSYLVIARDPVRFTAAYPNVTNVTGPFDFKLSNGGERVRLYDAFGQLKQSFVYSDQYPWPTLSDGVGGTIELLDPSSAIDAPSNWFLGCYGGSPGEAYSPCPCEQPNLGEHSYLCQSNPVQLNSGLELTGRSFIWYKNGIELPGEVSNNLEVNSAGVYTVAAIGSSCIKEATVEVSNNINVDLGEDQSVCIPSVLELEANETHSTATYIWKRNNVNMGLNQAEIKVTAEGTYSLTTQLAGCPAVTNSVNISSYGPLPNHDVSCSNGSKSLSVVGSGDYAWYTTLSGGAQINTGNNFLTPFLSTTTTYYVADKDFFAYEIGPKNRDFGDTWSQENFEDYKLKFEVFQDLSLNYITVFPEDPGSTTTSITIRILEGDETTVLHSVTVPAAETEQRIYLGYSLTPDTYTIDALGTVGELRMTNENASFPYVESGVLSIYRTEPDWAGDMGWYFFFYNFEVANGGSQVKCDRTPVTAFLCDDVDLSISADRNNIRTGENISIIASSTDEMSSFTWDFGVGAKPRIATGKGPHQVLFTERGIHDISVTAENMGGANTVTEFDFITVCEVPDFIQVTSTTDYYCGSEIQLDANPYADYNYQWRLFGDNVTIPIVDEYSYLANEVGDYTVNLTDPLNTELCKRESEFKSISGCVLGAFDNANDQIQLFPNPVNDHAKVLGLEGEYNIIVKDCRGIEVITQLNEPNVDFSTLPSGSYFIQVIQTKAVQSFKVNRL